MEFKEMMDQIPFHVVSKYRIEDASGNRTTIFKTAFTAEYPDVVITHAGESVSSEEYLRVVQSDPSSEPHHHAHDCFFLVFVNKGENLEVVEGKKITITENDLLLLTPQTIHHNYHTSECELTFFHINPAIAYRYFLPLVSGNILFSSFFSDYLTDQSIKKALFFPDCMSVIRPYLLKIMEEYTQKPILYNSVICNTLTSVILELARLNIGESRNYHPTAENTIRDMLSYISDHFQTVTLSEVASLYGYNSTYLSSLIKKKTGKSFRDLITDFRLTQACLLLQQNHLNVEQIAFSCGYQDSTSLYKAFMKKYHCSPGEWREKHWQDSDYSEKM